MDKTKKKKSGKTLRVVCIILAVLVVLVGGFTIVSHAVYHRSDMATLVEIYFRISGTKNKFADEKECAEYIEMRRNAAEYVLDVKLSSNVSESEVNGNKVYRLSAEDPPSVTILYLHGGAYINDATSYHWKLCDKLVQKTNAEVLFPIYPLTPEHTWEETFAMLTALYEDITDNNAGQLVIMGDSAGGGLAVAFCEYLREAGLGQPDKMILLSPWLDISMSNPDAGDYEAADPMLSAYGLTEMGKCWAGDLDIKDYKVSPIYGDISCLQNVYMFVGTREIFYPDVTKFYSMLQDNNVTSELIVGEGMNHVYPTYPIPEANEAIDKISNIIKE
ncbi:MAG: alpha/beta hydrolase [Ruminococcus sp.]|nr:alpha/beta hydrolase [Ruminococcus sp.]